MVVALEVVVTLYVVMETDVVDFVGSGVSLLTVRGVTFAVVESLFGEMVTLNRLLVSLSSVVISIGFPVLGNAVVLWLSSVVIFAGVVILIGSGVSMLIV